MRLHGLLLVALVAGFPAVGGGAPTAPERPVTKQIPAELAATVAGCWDLGPKYRVTIVRDGRDGLRAKQHATMPRHPRGQDYTAPVEYDHARNVLGFEGIGDIHRRVVTLRRVDSEWEFAFHSELSPGEWLDMPWQKAARCP